MKKIIPVNKMMKVKKHLLKNKRRKKVVSKPRNWKVKIAMKQT